MRDQRDDQRVEEAEHQSRGDDVPQLRAVVQPVERVDALDEESAQVPVQGEDEVLPLQAVYRPDNEGLLAEPGVHPAWYPALVVHLGEPVLELPHEAQQVI